MAKKPLTVTELARMGGKARAQKLRPEQRSEIAKKAVMVREAKRVKTLKEWLATAGEETLAQVRRTFGDPEEFYKKFVTEHDKVARNK
jgi:hypothetical protein